MLWNPTQPSNNKMEFLLYLTPESKQVLNQLYAAKFSVKENVDFCKRNRDTFGYADFGKKVVICTKNIKNSGYDLKQYLNQTVMHEAVHAAHFCNGFRPFGISKKQMLLSSNKQQSVYDSIEVSKAPYQIEHEAHWMESYPSKVKYVIQKYCF